MTIKKGGYVYLFLLIIIMQILLVGCNSNQVEPNEKKHVNTDYNISSNRDRWNSEISMSYKMKSSPYLMNVPGNYDDSKMSLESLKKGKGSLIKGKLINLEKIVGFKYGSRTKATILVEKVIYGKKSLENKIIKTEFDGGMSLAKDKYVSPEGQYVGDKYGIKSPDETIYSENPKFPIPKIGSFLILKIHRYQPDNKYQLDIYNQNVLNERNFYTVERSDTIFWVRKRGQFRLNNPGFFKPESEHKYPNLNKITHDLNKLLN